VTSECKFQGECSGTCPKCEAELRYLEEELKKRQKAGKAIAVAGIAAALLINTTGCGGNDRVGPETLTGDVPYAETEQTEQTEQIPTESVTDSNLVVVEPLQGDVPYVETELMGAPPDTEPLETESSETE